MDRECVTTASVLWAGQFQNRSYQNLQFYTDSCNINCIGVNVCSCTIYSLFQTLICQVRTFCDVIPDTAQPRGKETSFLVLGFYLFSLLPVLPSFYLPLSLIQFVPFFLPFLRNVIIYTFPFVSVLIFLLCLKPFFFLFFSFLSFLPNIPLTQSFLLSEFFTFTELTFFSYKPTYAYLDAYSSM